MCHRGKGLGIDEELVGPCFGGLVGHRSGTVVCWEVVTADPRIACWVLSCLWEVVENREPWAKVPQSS